jgi:hypothetical protein
MNSPRMLAPYEAVRLVIDHLRTNGRQVERVSYPIGSAPIVQVKGSSSAPGFRVSFLSGVSSLCGTRHEPVSWEGTIRFLRQVKEGLRDLKSRKRYLALGNERNCKALVITGSLVGRERELEALARELGFSLLLIDGEHAVISAGLDFPDSDSVADA